MEDTIYVNIDKLMDPFFPYLGINVSFDTFKDIKIHGVDVFQFNRGANHERK